jgi:hypothetical protein
MTKKKIDLFFLLDKMKTVPVRRKRNAATPLQFQRSESLPLPPTAKRQLADQDGDMNFANLFVTNTNPLDQNERTELENLRKQLLDTTATPKPRAVRRKKADTQPPQGLLQRTLSLGEMSSRESGSVAAHRETEASLVTTEKTHVMFNKDGSPLEMTMEATTSSHTKASETFEMKWDKEVQSRLAKLDQVFSVSTNVAKSQSQAFSRYSKHLRNKLLEFDVLKRFWKTECDFPVFEHKLEEEQQTQTTSVFDRMMQRPRIAQMVDSTALVTSASSAGTITISNPWWNNIEFVAYFLFGIRTVNSPEAKKTPISIGFKSELERQREEADNYEASCVPWLACLWTMPEMLAWCHNKELLKLFLHANDIPESDTRYSDLSELFIVSSRIMCGYVTGQLLCRHIPSLMQLMRPEVAQEINATYFPQFHDWTVDDVFAYLQLRYDFDSAADSQGSVPRFCFPGIKLVAACSFLNDSMSCDPSILQLLPRNHDITWQVQRAIREAAMKKPDTQHGENVQLHLLK